MAESGHWLLEASLRTLISAQNRGDSGSRQVDSGFRSPPGGCVSFFGELRRRNVFKVGGAYVVVASLLILVSGIVFPTVTLPAWTVAFVMVVLVLGFAAAVVLAWTYEVTPQGIKKTRRVRNSIARSTPPQNLHSRARRRR